MKAHLGLALGVAVVGLASVAHGTVLLSDSFNSRTNGSTSAPLVSSWGANDNALGGSIVQTYETSDPFNSTVAVVRNDRGELGWAFAEIQHDFAANLAGGGVTVEFSLIFMSQGGGNVNWWMGVKSGDITPSSVTDTIKQIPLQFTGTDIGLLWRANAATGGSFNSGVAVDNGFSSPHLRNGQPSQIRIDVFTTSAASGSPGTLRLTVDSNVVDINGAAAGTDLAFTWDADGAAYMGFGSNANAYYAIDNLRISAIPEPASLALLGVAGLLLAAQRRK
jgi:hypothetical protein